MLYLSDIFTLPHLVPFISWFTRSKKLGTEVMAPPGAHTVTPLAPSAVGPRDDQVYAHPDIQRHTYTVQNTIFCLEYESLHLPTTSIYTIPYS